MTSRGRSLLLAAATGLACWSCVAPGADPVVLAPDERASWLLVYRDQTYAFVPLAAAIELQNVETAEIIVDAEDANPRPTGLLRDPEPEQPSFPLAAPRRILRLQSGSWSEVPLPDSVFSQRRRSPCEGVTLKPLAPLPSRAVSGFKTLVPFGGGFLITAARAKEPSVSTLEWFDADRLEPYTAVIPSAAIDFTDVGAPLACADNRGGAWLLDSRNTLFHLRPNEPARAVKQLGRNFVADAMTCRPDADPDQPELFIRNFDFEVLYLAPGATELRPTDFRSRYVRVCYGLRRGPGVDTSIFESAGPRRLRAQFWQPRLQVVETATAPDASGVYRLRELEHLDLTDRGLPDSRAIRSAIARLPNGDELIVAQLAELVAPEKEETGICVGTGEAFGNPPMVSASKAWRRTPGLAWRSLDPPPSPEGRGLAVTEDFVLGTAGGFLMVDRAYSEDLPFVRCGRLQAAQTGDLLAVVGNVVLYAGVGVDAQISRAEFRR